MTHFKKLSAVFACIAIIIIGVAATTPPDETPHWKNLKVLKKDISHEELGKIMDNFKEALGVKCNFCHAPSKDSTVHHPDFASDEKPEKNIARHMMKMAAKINKKYFSFNKNEQGEMQQTVTCITCHRGSPHPEEKK